MSLSRALACACSVALAELDECEYHGRMNRRTGLLVLLSCLGVVACGNDMATDVQAAPGTELWEQRVAAYAYQIAVATDGSVFVAGYADGLWLGKFAADGTPLWTREDPGTYANDLTVGEDGGIYVVASDWFSDAPGDGKRIYRFDGDGTQVWRLEDPSLPTNAVTPAPGGGVYVGGGAPVVFMRLDGAGKVLWTAEEPALTNVRAMATTPRGELVATGSDETWWAHSRDSEGASLWTTDLGPAPAGGPRQPITVDSSGTVFVAAMAQNDPAGRGYLATLTANGVQISTRALPRPVTGLATVDEDVVIANLVPPNSVEVQRMAGEVVWFATPPKDCWKTWEVAAVPGSAIVALRECSDGAQILALQP